MTATKTRKLLINSGRAGVIYDKAGHTLGGGEHLPITDKLDDIGQAAVDAGYLAVVTVPEPAAQD